MERTNSVLCKLDINSRTMRFFLFLAFISPLFFSFSTDANTDRKVLFIGDSHSAQAVGDAIRETILNGERIKKENWFQYSIAGSCASHWLSGNFSGLNFGYVFTDKESKLQRKDGSPKDTIPAFAKLIDRHSPDHVVLLLGTNDMSYFLADLKKSPETPKATLLQPYLNRAAQIVAILEDQAYCTWIFVPGAKKFPPDLFRDFGDALIRTIDPKKCRVIDARELRLSYPGQILESNVEPNHADGIHFLSEMGYRLGQWIGHSLEGHF